MALRMLIMPALVMKLDSMLRLCRVLFSVSISATACVSPQDVTLGWHLGLAPSAPCPEPPTPQVMVEKPPSPWKSHHHLGLLVARVELGAGDCVPSLLGTFGDTGLGLTLATGSLLRVATRLSFLTWVLVFMASQMAFSVGTGMSCGEGTWVSPRGWGPPRGNASVLKGIGTSPRERECPQGDGDIPKGAWVSPRE